MAGLIGALVLFLLLAALVVRATDTCTKVQRSAVNYGMGCAVFSVISVGTVLLSWINYQLNHNSLNADIGFTTPMVVAAVIFGRLYLQACRAAKNEAAVKPAPVEHPKDSGKFPNYGRPQDTIKPCDQPNN